MNTSNATRWHRFLLIGSVLLFASVGCGRSGGNVPVNKSGAIKACHSFLEAWKNGKRPEDLKPSIYGSDYVWASGQKLVTFEILPNEISDGTNLHIPVVLTLQNSKGIELKSTASYAVGTSPVVTVKRDES